MLRRYKDTITDTEAVNMKVCSNCGNDNVASYRIWANGHGEKHRFMCSKCGMVADRTLHYSGSIKHDIIVAGVPNDQNDIPF